jgi:transposase InsO family protein
MDAEKASFPIALMCRVLEVSRSGYDAWRGRGLAERTRADGVVRERIVAIHTASRRVYGSPRIHAVLQAEGTRISRKRVARLMRQADLAGIRRGRRPRTTNTDPTQPVAPNLVARTFHADAPNRLWVGDLTYIPTGDGWLYLAVVLDVCSRRVIGWAMDGCMPVDLPLAALRTALRRRPAAGTIHHTDRGSQYTAAAYRAVVAANGLTASMSRRGNCYDNAVAESFFATLKTELVDQRHWPTRRAARQAIFEWIEVFYNRQRLHSSLAYTTPVSFDERMPPLPIAA